MFFSQTMNDFDRCLRSLDSIGLNWVELRSHSIRLRIDAQIATQLRWNRFNCDLRVKIRNNFLHSINRLFIWDIISNIKFKINDKNVIYFDLICHFVGNPLQMSTKALIISKLNYNNKWNDRKTFGTTEFTCLYCCLH